MAIPTFIIGSLTALTVFVCFRSSEQSGLSGLGKKTISMLYNVFSANNIVTFISHVAH